MTDVAAAAIVRLREQVPALVTVEGALDMAVLIERGTLPQRTPAAFVLSVALTAAPNEILGGWHDQALTENVAVVLVIRKANDPSGSRAAPELTTLRDQVRLALAGWAPDGCGALDFVSARLHGIAGGAAFLELSFNCEVT